MRGAILWIHAIAGAAWVVGSIAVAFAALATAPGPEQESFALRSAPRINAFNFAAAIVLLITGAINFVLAGMLRNFQFSRQFELVLAAKIVLFVGMLIALRLAVRAAASIRRTDGAEVAHIMNQLVRIDGAIAAMGAVALLLGLWLIGS